MRKAGHWLDRQPVWSYLLIMFPVLFVSVAAGDYADAWLSGGSRHRIINGDAWFPNGHFSVPGVLMIAVILTGCAALGRLWRRRSPNRRAS